MKPLLIFHIHGSLERVQHEVAQTAQYEIVGEVSMSLGDNGMPLLADADQEKLLQTKQAGGAGFIVGDDSMLNQHRLAAYMAIKRQGLPVVAIQSMNASVAPGIRLRENVYIDHAVRVLARSNIGANTWILQGSELGSDCKIGSSCWIGRHCCISERAVIGKNCILGDGVSIGPDVTLPDWSIIKKNGAIIQESPKMTIFLDPRFRAPVHLFHRH